MLVAEHDHYQHCQRDDYDKGRTRVSRDTRAFSGVEVEGLLGILGVALLDALRDNRPPLHPCANVVQPEPPGQKVNVHITGEHELGHLYAVRADGLCRWPRALQPAPTSCSSFSISTSPRRGRFYSGLEIDYGSVWRPRDQFANLVSDLDRGATSSIALCSADILLYSGKRC